MSAAMGMMLSVSKFAIQRTRKTQDANLTLKQAVEDSGDTSVNPTMLHAEVKEEHTRSAEQSPTSSKTKKSIK